MSTAYEYRGPKIQRINATSINSDMQWAINY